MEGDGASREGLKALLSSGSRSHPGFNVLLAESRSFRERRDAAVNVLTDRLVDVEVKVSNASVAVLAARGAVFAVWPSWSPFSSRGRAGPQLKGEPPGKRQLVGTYMLCCACEVNDNFAALQHASLTRHFRMLRWEYSSRVNHVFHTLNV